MKKLLSLSVMALLVLSVLPMVFAASIGSSVGVDITTEKFPPQVWGCDQRVVKDDATEPGRISSDGQTLVERINNYAFEGESIQWTVLVMDKNGKEKIQDVFGTVGGSDSQGAGNPIEVNCVRQTGTPTFTRDVHYEDGKIPSSCNARIGEEKLTQFDPTTMAYYTCTLTVESADAMPSGKYWITIEATDMDSSVASGTMAENEYWYLNPNIALTVDGDLTFADVRPGTASYSNTLLVGNDADAGSGVMMDMFISGTDFYDSASEGAMCPTTNQLSLGAFRYYATNGAYSTSQDLGVGRTGNNGQPAAKDAEGYVGIGYGIGFNNPNPFYDGYEILQQAQVGPYYTANILAPGSQMPLTFKLSLPEPCNGDFNSGKISFWGEAI